jgi:hypothetical protein
MPETDELILDHLGRYVISIRSVIEHLFFGGGSCGSTLTRLADRQLIQRVTKSFEGGYSYYQLTPKGAKSRGLPPNRGLPKNETAIAQNLAALWFACRAEVPRLRLNDDELNTLFGAPEGGNTIHVAQSGIEPTVFRLFVPGEGTSVKQNYVRALKKSASDVMENKNLLPWIERGTYRFAVLVHSEVRKENLDRLLASEAFPKLTVQIEIAPTPSTLPAFLPGKEEA